MSKLGVCRTLPVLTTSAAFFLAVFPMSAGAQHAPLPTTSETSIESASNHVPPPPVDSARMEPTQEQIGDTYMMKKRYQAAIEAYKKEKPETAGVWNKMGIAYQLMLDQDDAAACYRRSLRLDAKSANVMNNLGTIYGAQKRYHDAEKMYREALKIDPKSAIIRKNLGTSYLAEHKYKKGWAAYEQALALDPQIFSGNGGPKVQDTASVQDRGAMNYYMARGCAQAGMSDCAISYLRMALIEGYTNAKKLSTDREFANLHGQPAFEELLVEKSNR